MCERRRFQSARHFFRIARAKHRLAVVPAGRGSRFCFFGGGPFFNNVDEQIHLDLAVKYSQGHIPRSFGAGIPRVVPYATLYGSPEYVGIPTNFPGGLFPPPPWTQPWKKSAGPGRKKRWRGGSDEL